MTALAAIIAALEPADAGWRGAIPEDWLQGRTGYGGLSAALALVAAKRADADLPPLRSAQVAFVGPLAGSVHLRPRLLRRGRNAAWVGVEIEGEAGVGLVATFVFMRPRESALAHAHHAAPDAPPPERGAETTSGPRSVVFTRNFEFVDPPVSPSGPAEWLRWTRLRERERLDPEVELLAVADCLPPAALRLARERLPLSSMTWQIDLLGAAPGTDGWHLLHAATDHAAHGVSSQRMAIWNSRREAVAQQMQSVALFG